MENKEKALKKLKFYDKSFVVFSSFIIMFFGAVYLLPENGRFTMDIILVIAFPIIISLSIINWGMFYHQIKSKSYGWFSVSIISFFIGIAPLIFIIFYWVKMRKEFKKGNGIYN